MLNRKALIKFFVVFIIIIFFFLLMFVIIDSFQVYKHENISTRFFKIEQQIMNDDMNYKFTELQSYPTNEYNSNLGVLSSKDFYNIFQEFLTQIDSVTLSEWKIQDVFYRTKCSLVEEGFISSGFIFSKNVIEDRINYSFIKKISIGDFENFLSVENEEYMLRNERPELVNWTTTNFSEVYPPEEIMDKAYSYAWDKFPQSFSDFSIILDLGNNNDLRWHVFFYFSADFSNKIEVIIDPFSGEIITKENY